MTTHRRKVEHVRGASQTRPHKCHGRMPGCKGQCPPAMWGCRNCWYKLPKWLRDEIWAAYQPGQEEWDSGKGPLPSREYLSVARKAQQWIKENYPSEEEDG